MKAKGMFYVFYCSFLFSSSYIFMNMTCLSIFAELLDLGCASVQYFVTCLNFGRVTNMRPVAIDNKPYTFITSQLWESTTHSI